jgi:hypothetical protein
MADVVGLRSMLLLIDVAAALSARVSINDHPLMPMLNAAKELDLLLGLMGFETWYKNLAYFETHTTTTGIAGSLASLGLILLTPQANPSSDEYIKGVLHHCDHADTYSNPRKRIRAVSP